MAGNSNFQRSVSLDTTGEEGLQGHGELVGVLAESVKHPADFVGLGFQLLDQGSLLSDLVFAFLPDLKAF